ncbi:BMP family lipoprotein [Melissococcus plutonius]|uniref:Predicted nucleoside ABC transporter, substrate-binding component n=1 Tax=Melissococcus plutonius (strain ATCC 35311 / DSM 29964 / CIP 104052 / LMG 20360 / NCIMB 702443) TaxID=940190 RepID=F3Y899_MELPT|nr:BMP family protein [Melissococcus plutonius]AIM24444.1 putative ABC-type transport system, periplasmic component/surface lipoprotein [Melissococcus plutonius S1]KMT25856.1 putative ABC-type transport system, periplasmic component/surface lipoprotein [Melissococcus plutonius]KMT27201.1 putative ABC-type transport system, periplasmic component/surface lipoprotein [Melissococcus plutonius]KMT28302.1 putative ABC-type transport system, periplasmic component/surface lipoprotein [Melissococcus plu
MKKAKLLGLGVIALTVALSLAACGGKHTKNSSKKGDPDHNIVMISDIGGIDDKSFNQSAWEGMKAWGKKHDLPEGVKGYAYIQSKDASQYTSNVDQAITNNFKTVFGVGYLIKDTIQQAAKKNPKTQFAIIDDVIADKKNVVSATFKDNEAAYLAGVAAAYTTKTNKLGFVGGEERVVIDRFQAGYQKGVADAAKKLGKTITVNAKYVASFADSAKGRALAASMYQEGTDIIFHAAGASGQGVFQEAAARNKAGNGDKVWVIGVDRDQQDDGNYKTKDGKKDNFTLTSTLKGVGASVQDIADRALKDKFPGGKHLIYGLKAGGVDITKGNLSDSARSAVKEAKEKVISGEIKVPEKPENR